LARPHFHAPDLWLLELKFGSDFDIRRSFSEMKAGRAFSIVILPEPVPPEMIVVTRAATLVSQSVSLVCILAREPFVVESSLG
jgi:hypothetical protein